MGDNKNMSQKQSVDMSQYREQQQLLSGRSAEDIVQDGQFRSKLMLQHSLSQQIPCPKVQAPSRLNHNANSNSQEDINVHNPQPSQQSDQGDLVANAQRAINQNGSVNPNIPQPLPAPQDPYRIFRILLDYVVLLIFAIKSIVTWQISMFATFWIVSYLAHILTIRSLRRQIKRNFVAMVFIWPILTWIFEGIHSINTDQRVFMLAYLIEVIPFILGCMCACCIASCTCVCATCCICWYAFSQTRASIFGCLQRIRYRKLKQELCNQELTNVQDRQCPICLEVGSQMNTLNCHHSFHPKCLGAWINAHKTCPVCRRVLY